MTLTFLISQVFAGIAIVADLCSFQFKERKKIIIFFIIAASCITLHYFLLERYVAAVIVLLGVVRFFVSYYRTDTYFIYIFILAYILTTYFLYQDIYDLIILVSISLATIGVFQKNDKYLRLFMMSGTSLIIIYNFLIFSPMGALLEGIFLCSNLIGYYRYYIRKSIKPGDK